jgi:hypothetical protein
MLAACYNSRMFGDGSLTLREFAMKEPLPLARIHDAVLEFLRNREDAALFGAQAVNAYVDEPRMTQDVDIMSDRAATLANELREYLIRPFISPSEYAKSRVERDFGFSKSASRRTAIWSTFDRSVRGRHFKWWQMCASWRRQS